MWFHSCKESVSHARHSLILTQESMRSPANWRRGWGGFASLGRICSGRQNGAGGGAQHKVHLPHPAFLSAIAGGSSLVRTWTESVHLSAHVAQTGRLAGCLLLLP